MSKKYTWISKSHIVRRIVETKLHSAIFLENKTPAKAFTPPAKTKMITRPGRAVTRAFIGGVVYSLIFVLPRVPSKAFSDIASTSFVITKITKNQCLACLSDLPGTLPRVQVRLHFLEFDLN